MTAPAMQAASPRAAIPFVDLKAQDAPARPAIDQAIRDVIDSGAFIQGQFAAAFAGAFLERLGAAHGVGCANGTVALALALQALGVGPGDEVITSPLTFIATAESILAVGATPVLADIDRDHYGLDPAAAAAAVTSRTAAIVPVHLYGCPGDLDGLATVAARHGLALVEDAAQAHLATYRERTAGTIGDAGTFSFYPGKNLGAYGDAGFIVARDPAVAAKAAKLLDHGRVDKYRHDIVGQNGRMDGLQAAILTAKLPHLDGWTANRRARAAQYDTALLPAGFKTVIPPDGAVSSRHLYVIEAEDRDDTRARLAERGIATGLHYPIPLHLQPALCDLPHALGEFPMAEAAAARVLSLPICGAISEAAITRVAEAVRESARP